MNAIRTIQAGEQPHWVQAIFHRGKVRGGPDWPLRFPFPFTVDQACLGGILYVLHKGSIIGWGQIARIGPRPGDHVGTSGQPVARGDAIWIKDAFRRMPHRLVGIGFPGIRKTAAPLHTMSQPNAQAALRLALGR